LEFTGGVLGCAADCHLDTSGCLFDDVVQNCGNGVVEFGEQCDGSDFGGVSTSCSVFSPSFSGGSLFCDGNCLLSTSGCVEVASCGNGVVDDGESCDGSVFVVGSGRCVDYSVEFVSGSLLCGAGCQIDTGLCQGVPVGVCGDGRLNGGEECDGRAFGVVDTCVDFPQFESGVLRCGVDCVFDTSRLILLVGIWIVRVRVCLIRLVVWMFRRVVICVLMRMRIVMVFGLV